MPTDTSEKGLETLIEKYLLEQNGYFRGISSDYSTDYALDCNKVETFLCDTQQDKVRNAVDFSITIPRILTCITHSLLN